MSFVATTPLEVDNVILNESALGTFEPASPDIYTVLFQTGYLTIVDVDTSTSRLRYHLDFPNFEVLEGFNT